MSEHSGMEWSMERAATVGDMIRMLESERYRLRERVGELEHSLAYWLPDETWMRAHYPNDDHACKASWDAFYKACSLLAKAGK